MEAPVKEGEELGTVRYTLDGTLLLECPVIAGQEVEERTFSVCADWLKDSFFLGI